jgi:hypothetical protein
MKKRCWNFLWLVTLLLAVGKVGQAQDSLGMRCLTTLEYWNSATGIQMVDSLAYMCSGYLGLRIMDLSDPVNPVEIGRSPWNQWNYSPCGVYVNGSLAYITYLNDGSVLDISDPAHPTEIHHWYLVYSPVIVFVHGDVAVGLNEEEYPRIMDISDWNNVHVTSWFPGLTGPSYPVGMVGNYLCLAGWGVEMYDISDPRNPVLVAVVDDTVYTGWSAKLSGNYVYLSTSFHGVRVYDVSDPLHPVAVAVCDTNGCGDISISASHLFISKGLGLHIWDITDPTHPVFTGEYPLSLANPTTWIASSGNLLCAALDFSENQTVAVLDISNPASPMEVSRFGKRGFLRRVVINGTTGYLSDIYAGFHIIDLSDPSRAIELGRPFGSMGLDDIAVRGNYLYGVDYNYGLITYSVEDPAHPESLNCWQNVGNFHPTAVTIVGDYAWVNSYIFSLANPASPVFVDSSSVIGSDFRAANGYVYSVADRYFFIYNASNPTAPELIGSCTMPFYWGGTAKDLAIAGDYAYVAYYAGGVQIIDIADPEHPAVVGSVGANWVTAVAASGNTMAFYQIASNYQQSMIYIMDISDPVYPRYIGHYNISEMMSDMEIYGSYLLTVSPNKFAVYQVDALSSVQPHESLPQEFALYPCYPNPFNSSTTINCSLPVPGIIDLTVFNITGRKVRTLINGFTQAGTHRVLFDGSELASGIYFACFKHGQQIQTRKMVLMK